MLNSHYTSQTNADTFTTSGRTDLLSRVEDRNLFLAECLTLKRPKSPTDKLEQLFGGATCADMRMCRHAPGTDPVRA